MVPGLSISYEEGVRVYKLNGVPITEEQVQQRGLNSGALRQFLVNSLAPNRIFVARTNPTQQQIADQVEDLTRQMNAIIKILTEDFNDVN